MSDLTIKCYAAKKKVEQTSTSKIKVGSEGEFVNPSQKRISTL